MSWLWFIKLKECNEDKKKIQWQSATIMKLNLCFDNFVTNDIWINDHLAREKKMEAEDKIFVIVVNSLVRIEIFILTNFRLQYKKKYREMERNFTTNYNVHGINIFSDLIKSVIGKQIVVFATISFSNQLCNECACIHRHYRQWFDEGEELTRLQTV